MDEFNEVSTFISHTEDKKTYSIEFKSKKALTIHDIIIELECFLTEIIKAQEQKENSMLH